MTGMGSVRVLSLVVGMGILTACAGVSFTKAGEEDAVAACKALSNLQGDDVTINQGIEAMATAAVLAERAAKANDDYQMLASAMNALNESMFVGSEDLAQSAWANVATLCNDL